MAFTLQFSEAATKALDGAVACISLDRKAVIANACSLYLMVKNRMLDGARIGWFSRSGLLVCDIDLPPGYDDAGEWPDSDDGAGFTVEFAEEVQAQIDRLAERMDVPRSRIVQNALGLYVWCIKKILNEKLFFGIGRADGRLEEIICVPGIDNPNA